MEAIRCAAGRLKTRQILLILDNCEHVIPSARDIAASIIQSCPQMRILSTSREALNLPGECVYRLPSLAVPLLSNVLAEDVLPYGAVALFVDRAIAVDTAFKLTDGNATDIAEICRRLDGIPLAIELAAARAKVIAPRQIAARLDQRFRLLTGGDAAALPRNKTMTALLDWSYDLLTPREQRFFESLSVFAGGCTLEAATAVCASDDEDDIAVIDLIASLVGKSLLLAESMGNEQRYRLLESSREYAQGKLAAHGELGKIARQHANFFVELAERLNDAWETIPDQEWLPQATVELENWRATMDWALTRRGDLVLGQRMAGARHVIGRSLALMEARRWVGAALKLLHENTPSTLVARLELAEATIAGRLAEHRECLAAAERALARYRQNGDLVGIAQAQTLAGGSLVIFERFAEAEPLLRDALEAARKFGHRRLAVAALRMMAHARTLVGDFTGARASYTEALRLANAVGAEHLAASIAASLSGNEYDAGDFKTALRLCTDAMGAYRRLGLSALPNLANSVGDIAKYLIALGRYDEARSHAREALELARGVRYPVMVAILLQQLAVLELLRTPIESRSASASFTAAAHTFGFVDGCLAKHGIPKKYGLEEYDGALELLRSATGEQELARLMVAGAMMTEDDAIAQARARVTLAWLALVPINSAIRRRRSGCGERTGR